MKTRTHLGSTLDTKVVEARTEIRAGLLDRCLDGKYSTGHAGKEYFVLERGGVYRHKAVVGVCVTLETYF